TGWHQTLAERSKGQMTQILVDYIDGVPLRRPVARHQKVRTLVRSKKESNGAAPAALGPEKPDTPAPRPHKRQAAGATDPAMPAAETQIAIPAAVAETQTAIPVAATKTMPAI